MSVRSLVLIAALAVFAGCARQSDSSALHEVGDFSVDVLARSQTTSVLVDFWAPWCGPCRMLKPVLERAAAESEGRWVLVAINVDSHPALAEQFGIQSIPAVKLFHRGEVVAEFVGVKSDSGFRSWLETNLPKN